MSSEPGVTARFHYHPYLNRARSREEGRPIYEDRVYVEILVAGMDKQTVNRPAQEKDKVRFAAEWAAFSRGEEARRVGTPVAEWPRMAQTPSMVKMLESINIFTVEDLAALSDGLVPKLGMGGFKLRDEARRFIELAKEEVRASESEALRAKNADLERRLAELEERLASAGAPEAPAEPVRARKKPGPKPRATA